METWQIEHINNRLVELIKITKCNVQLVVGLRQAQIISAEEEEPLTLPNLISMEKSRKLYEILVTRTNSYDVLVQLLQQGCQTGAVNILRPSADGLLENQILIHHLQKNDPEKEENKNPKNVGYDLTDTLPSPTKIATPVLAPDKTHLHSIMDNLHEDLPAYVVPKVLDDNLLLTNSSLPKCLTTSSKAYYIKLLVAGDAVAGKTELLITYATKSHPGECIPTVFDDYTISTKVNGYSVVLNLQDTSGLEDYLRLRLLQYPKTDVLLLCFSLVSPSSLESISTKWHRELQDNCPNTPVILVGTQLHLREDDTTIGELKRKNLAPVLRSKGESVAKKIKAVKYLECSAVTQVGVNTVFDEAIRVVLYSKGVLCTEEKEKCNIS